MEIRFGHPLNLTDGSHTGSIQRVVLESETQRLRALTVKIGHLFARERIIGSGCLQPSDDGRRVVADLTPADLAQLPCISDVNLSDAAGSRERVQPYAPLTGGEVSMPGFVGGSAAVNRRVPLHLDAPAADIDVTMVGTQTTVHGAGGSRIGTVSAVVCDLSGTAIGLMVRRSQMFRSREIYVPTDLASYSGASSGILGLEWRE